MLSGFIVACLARWEHDQLIEDETENPVYNEIMIREGQRSLPILSATTITSLSGVEPGIIAGQADRAALIYEGIFRLLTTDPSPEGTTGGTPGRARRPIRLSKSWITATAGHPLSTRPCLSSQLSTRKPPGAAGIMLIAMPSLLPPAFPW